ncbi:tRNA (adenosine(37)-N6)-threonylcarbamoyltransferase complex dimerization subunit type 1 TsaB [Rheinheimera sp. 4Y26]|uniref:tRNA (adenosine(37)-N6)-threonylcarbamoyltransferase complex dimerization subunit type 1 TsaB n=1 Tax=Rheinheimera sp. 4Y26 TaxID=2977811 RepID=UPI0021B12D2C|nr:tRNA (adenosine(37)-N6)-threonylcarbamoyltransferase complex dimerization subunit type 1 TsaB [Rheinheimera sp. 4Y26]MCT6701455.1 tRNA (adenosine(37)-N6)-threonylcarbamoyltransferase complex dimerization subunit type 1 TsaB [Rheinheimera sp. 4Y26]
MKLLALDTSTEACSVALQIDSDILSLDEVCPQQHSKRVLPMVQQLLSQAGIALKDLDGIVFGRGPGSFTGVRIGVGVAQGLAFGAGLPLYGVSTLAAMAQAAQRLYGADKVVAAIDARMAEVYLGCYQLDASGLMQLLGEEIARKPAELMAGDVPAGFGAATVFGVGTGFQTYAEALNAWQPVQISSEILYPSAQDMLTLSTAALAKGLFVAPELAEPTYVRDEVTWQKLPGR